MAGLFGEGEMVMLLQVINNNGNSIQSLVIVIVSGSGRVGQVQVQGSE